jgi:hypothetical protein
LALWYVPLANNIYMWITIFLVWYNHRWSYLDRYEYFVSKTITMLTLFVVEVLRDVKAMTVDRKITTMKILKASAIGGG